MAGGSSNDLSTPWPKGEYPGIPLIFSGLSKTGAGTGATILASMTLPFSCKPLYAEFIAGGAVTDADADTTLKIIDDTGTPKEFVTATVLTALAAGARKQFTVNKSVEFYAQAIMQVVATFGDAGDVFENGTVVLWVKPTN